MARWKRQEVCVWTTENMSTWPSGHRKTEKSGHRLAAEETLFPRRWYGGMISANLEVIWEMSAKGIVKLNSSEVILKMSQKTCLG